MRNFFRHRMGPNGWKGASFSTQERRGKFALLTALLFCALLIGFNRLPAAPLADGEANFGQTIRPLLNEYCLKCHSTDKHKGDLDLERFSSLSEVRRHPKVWQMVAEQLANKEMPPKEKPQPTPVERERLAGWVDTVLDEVALAQAGDPGPVVLRRLSNAEYTYTVRDLTGLESLDPTREFPVDGAAGEGFMNTGNALVMSPSLLTKYLNAGKLIASHAVLLPEGIRFSPATSARDWTEEFLTQIREFYRAYTDPRGGDKVNLQGIVFDTNQGGRLPLERYLAATLEMRDRHENGRDNSSNPKNPLSHADGWTTVAAEHGLSPKYLAILWTVLNATEPSSILDGIRARWRQAKPGDAAALAAEIAQWQKALWKFSSVGHIGKAGGPKGWMEPVSPLTTNQEVRLKITPPADAGEVTLYLVASDAGDGNQSDFVLWQQPRLIAPGRPSLLLRDVRAVSQELTERRERIFASTAKSLAAAAEASASPDQSHREELARKHGVEPGVLAAWLNYLGLGMSSSVKIDSYFTNVVKSSSGYDFIQGWHNTDLPNLLANSSDQHVRVPGNMKPHSVAVHPSPKLQVGIGWRSPIAATLRVEAAVTHAHPECGNGVTWSLELRRGATRQRLATGIAQGSKEVKVAPIEKLTVQPGDLVSLLIGPRDGNHACDLTALDLVLTSAGADGREWNLARDVSPDVLAGNPHPDRFGNEGVWHFYTEPDKGGSEMGPVIPAGSLLAKWQAASSPQEKQGLADEVQKLLSSGPPAAKESPDAKLYQQLASLGGPLLAGDRTAWKNGASRSNRTVAAAFPPTRALLPGEKEKVSPSVGESERAKLEREPRTSTGENPAKAATEWGLAPTKFGRHPNGQAIDEASLCVRAPSVIEIRLPADLVAGCEFVTTGVLDKETGAEGSVQLQVLTTKPAGEPGLVASTMTVTEAGGLWTSNNRRISHATPILVNDGSAARRRIEDGLEQFRAIFPAALCYTKIVPVDEVVTLTLFYREDHHLARLMLDDAQKAKLDQMWSGLHFVSRDALTLVDVFEQIWQFATQDADPKVFEPLRKPIQDRAAAFRQLLVETEPQHLTAVLDFAARAYRRPLTGGEADELRGLYRKLRDEALPHEEAIRLTLARVFIAPAFLYRLEKAAPGAEPGLVSNWELASRLSYFLWSSAPDAELLKAAAAGTLREPEVLAAQARRMLRDARTRRLATEFACQWLHIHDFDTLDEKSERHFPTFANLRGAMYEESIRFFTDLFQRDGSVLDFLDADYTFLNEPLAKHYGIPGVTGPEWRRVDGLKKAGRGGILGQAATLAKQSGASRTSPILRGNWVAEALLGDKLPRPPKDVPRLPEDEATENLTVRQLTEKHSADPKCAGCHVRIDAFGYALESFDAIGRRRERDLGDRPIDTRAKTMDGTELAGIDGLRSYLLTQRREAFLRQLGRKLLGYALGRAVQLSDKPLLTEMQRQWREHDYRFSAAVETVVRSRQFREIRGKEMASAD